MKQSRRVVWTARAMWGIAVSFLAFDAIGKLLALDPVIEGSARLGYSASSVVTIGIIELICVTLYVVPPTAVLGALLMTGYLGGAVATHVRIGDPLFSHILFPVYVAVLLWGALVIRDQRLGQVARWRQPSVPVHAPSHSQEVSR